MLAVHVICYAAAGVLILIGAWVLLRALVLDRSRGRRRCPRCWYELGAGTLRVCPECGKEARSERALLRTRRRWRMAGMAATIIVAGMVSIRVPIAWEVNSWWELAPSWVVRTALAPFTAEQEKAFRKARYGPQKLTRLEEFLAAAACARVLGEPRPEPTFGVERDSWVDYVARRSAAIKTLPELGRTARLAVPQIVSLTKSDEPKDVGFGLLLLRQLPATEGTTPALARLARDRRSEVRWAAVEALADRKARLDLVTPALLRGLKERPRRAAEYLGKLASYGPPAVPELSKLLESPDSGVRLAAVYELIRLSPHAGEVENRMVRALDGLDDAAAHELVGRLIWKAGSSAVVEAAVTTLWPKLDYKAKHDLITGSTLPYARAVWQVSELPARLGLRDSEVAVRFASVRFYAEHYMAPDDQDKAVLRELAERDPSEQVRAMAAEALRRGSGVQRSPDGSVQFDYSAIFQNLIPNNAP